MSHSIASAQCLCTAVSWKVTGKNRGTVLCHCSDCRAFSGSAFAYNCQFTDATLEILQGQKSVKEFDSTESVKSGNTVTRSFCGQCGSPICLRIKSKPKVIVIAAGATGMDQKPKLEFFKDNKCFWVGEVVESKL